MKILNKILYLDSNSCHLFTHVSCSTSANMIILYYCSYILIIPEYY